MAEPTHFADYVTVVTNIDRKKYGKRIVPMRVLVLGLGRTGTESLKRALQLLGIHEVYHTYNNAFENPRDNEMWLEALEAKYEGKGKPYGRAEFDKLLGHCQAVSNMPAICFAEELVAAYPEAKVILTVRDIDSWYRSYSATVTGRVKYLQTSIVTQLRYLFRLHSRFTNPAWTKAFKHFMEGDFKKNGKRIYCEHNDKVRSLVGPDRLLEYQIQDGWKPLCDFLGIEQPKEVFPQENDKGRFEQRFDRLDAVSRQAIYEQMMRLALLILVVFYLLSWVKAKMRFEWADKIVGSALVFFGGK